MYEQSIKTPPSISRPVNNIVFTQVRFVQTKISAFISFIIATYVFSIVNLNESNHKHSYDMA